MGLLCLAWAILGLVMANIIIIEFKNKVIKPLMNDSTIKLYCQYVDVTLLIVKPQDFSLIHKLFNGCGKNLPLFCLKMKFSVFFAWTCHEIESRFIGRTLILGYMEIIQVLYHLQ